MSDRTEDERAVRAVLARLYNAWTAGDGAAYAEQFSPDADYVSFDGTRQRGRESIAASHAELFAFLRGSRLFSDTADVRFIGPDAAIVVATGAVLLPWQRSVQRSRRSINTTLLTRQLAGRWLIESFQNTRVAPQPLPTGFGAALFQLFVRVASRRRALPA